MMPVYVLVFLVALMGFYMMFVPETNNRALDINGARSVATALATQHEAALKKVYTDSNIKDIFSDLERQGAGGGCKCPLIDRPDATVQWLSCPMILDAEWGRIPLDSASIAALLNRGSLIPSMPAGIISSAIGCTKSSGEVVVATWVNTDIFNKVPASLIADALMEQGDYGAGDGISHDNRVVSNGRVLPPGYGGQYQTGPAAGTVPFAPLELPHLNAQSMVPEGAPVKATLVKKYE